jgi:hypothetical protein
MDQDWLKKFDPETFELNGQKNGITFETIKLVDLMTTYEPAKDVVSKSIKTMIK